METQALRVDWPGSQGLLAGAVLRPRTSDFHREKARLCCQALNLRCLNAITLKDQVLILDVKK